MLFTSAVDILFNIGPLLTSSSFECSLQMPSPVPVYLNIHYICETASRLLFQTTHWAKSIPAFQQLGSVTILVLPTCQCVCE